MPALSLKRADVAIIAARSSLEREGQEVARQQENKRIQLLIESLTPRERQVFLLVAAGLANKNIATRVGVSLQTVKLHNVMFNCPAAQIDMCFVWMSRPT